MKDLNPRETSSLPTDSSIWCTASTYHLSSDDTSCQRFRGLVSGLVRGLVRDLVRGLVRDLVRGLVRRLVLA